MTHVIGIDFGATNIKSTAVDDEDGLVAEWTEPTTTEHALDPAGRVRQLLEEWLAEMGEAPEAIGLAAPGLAARNARSITWMQGRLDAIQGLDWLDALDLSIPVRVLNDAQAALLGETWMGSAAGSENVVLLTLGTGVGGAIMCDGRLLRGAIGRAGHLGHACLDPDGPPDIVGTPGSLEDFIGDHTVAARTGGRFSSTRELASAFWGDNPKAKAEAEAPWLLSINRLACAAVTFINAVDPEVLVIGGGIAEAGPALFGPLQAELDKLEWRPGGHRVRLARAELGEMAGAIGAARYAMTYGEGL